MRKTIYECDGPQCEAEAEASGKGLPEGWAALVVGDERFHFASAACVKEFLDDAILADDLSSEKTLRELVDGVAAPEAISANDPDIASKILAAMESGAAGAAGVVIVGDVSTENPAAFLESLVSQVAGLGARLPAEPMKATTPAKFLEETGRRISSGSAAL